MGPKPTTTLPAPTPGRDHDPGTYCACTAQTWAGPGGDIVVLAVAGEIDLLTYPVLHDALNTALFGTVDQPPCDLVVDLAAVTFCCIRGYVLLTETAHTAAATDTGYALSGLPRQLHRLEEILRHAGDDTIPHYRSAAAAVTAIRTRQTDRFA